MHFVVLWSSSLGFKWELKINAGSDSCLCIGLCSPAKDAASAPEQNWQGQGRRFAIVKEGKAFLSIFFQDRGKESSSCYTLCIKGRSKLSEEIPEWEGEAAVSFFLLFSSSLPCPLPLLGGSQNPADICAQDLFCGEMWIVRVVGGYGFM